MTRRRSIGGLAFVNAAIATVSVVTTTVIGWLFGTSRSVEIYFAAASLMTLLFKLFQSGQLSELFLPEYLRLKSSRGVGEAQLAFAVVFNWMVLLSCVGAVMLYLMAPMLVQWLAPGFDSGEQEQVVRYFLWMVPLIPIQLANALVQMLGNADKLYGKFEMWILAGSVGSLLMICLGHHHLGAGTLVASLWIGQLLPLAGRFVVLQRGGYRHRCSLACDLVDLSSLLRQLCFTAFYVAATQWFLFMFTAALTRLPPGTFACFKYAELLYLRTSSLFIRPVSTVFFTDVAEAWHTRRNQVTTVLRQALNDVVVGYLLIVAILGSASVHVFAFLWGGPRFPAEAIQLTAWVLLAFYVVLVFEVTTSVVRKVTMVAGKMVPLYLLTTVVQLAMAGIAPWLVDRWALLGAVIAVIVGAVLLCTANLVMLRRCMAVSAEAFPVRRILLGSGIVAGVALFVRWIDHQIFEATAGGGVHAVADKWAHGALAASNILGALLMLWALARISGDEAADLPGDVFRKFKALWAER